MSVIEQMKGVISTEWADTWAKAGITEEDLKQFVLMKGIVPSEKTSSTSTPNMRMEKEDKQQNAKKARFEDPSKEVSPRKNPNMKKHTQQPKNKKHPSQYNSKRAPIAYALQFFWPNTIQDFQQQLC